MSGPAYHGRTHVDGGTDPIPGGLGIRFDVDNEGGWLYVVTNDSTDIEFGDLGMLLADSSESGITVAALDNLRNLISRVSLTVDDIRVQFVAGLGLLIEASTGTVTVTDATGDPLLQMTDGSPDLHLPTGGNVVFDL